MLVYRDDTTTSLTYTKPTINTVAIAISIIGLAAVVIVLAVAVFKERQTIK